jgi:hypothetical protein
MNKIFLILLFSLSFFNTKNIYITENDYGRLIPIKKGDYIIINLKSDFEVFNKFIDLNRGHRRVYKFTGGYFIIKSTDTKWIRFFEK